MGIEASSKYDRPTQITAGECRLEITKAPEYILALQRGWYSSGVWGMIGFVGFWGVGFFCLFV